MNAFRVFLGFFVTAAMSAADGPVAADAESPAQAQRRHAQVAQRRKQTVIICHRGASEFAHENTLEAYRATLELGGDGNEIDIRTTKNGVLVCFHDDMLDRLLGAYGTVRETHWLELRSFRFRDPGIFGKHCRIPTLREVLLLHRRHAGLLHLDIKEPAQDKAIADLLDELDMWDHVAFCNDANAGILRGHPKLKLLRYKAPGLFDGRLDVDPQAIAVALQKPGDGLIVDDPRAAIVALGRKLGTVSRTPVDGQVIPHPITIQKTPSASDLISTLGVKAIDWDVVAQSAEDQARSGERIRNRARAAEWLLTIKADSPAARQALVERVHKRSLHKHWMFHGFDGAMALRSLILLRAPEAVDTARFVLWRDDPDLRKVYNPEYKTPVSWTDFRLQMVIFPALEKHPGAATEKLCRYYLAQSDEEARKYGPPQFEAAAKALLAVRPETAVALELLKHRRGDVRGRTILQCLAHAQETWARQALEQQAPHALAYVVGGK